MFRLPMTWVCKVVVYYRLFSTVSSSGGAIEAIWGEAPGPLGVWEGSGRQVYFLVRIGLMLEPGLAGDPAGVGLRLP